MLLSKKDFFHWNKLFIFIIFYLLTLIGYDRKLLIKLVKKDQRKMFYVKLAQQSAPSNSQRTASLSLCIFLNNSYMLVWLL